MVDNKWIGMVMINDGWSTVLLDYTFMTYLIHIGLLTPKLKLSDIEHCDKHICIRV